MEITLKERLQQKVPGRYNGFRVPLSEINIEAARRNQDTGRIEYIQIEDIQRKLENKDDLRTLKQDMLEIAKQFYLEQGYKVEREEKGLYAHVKKENIDLQITVSAMILGKQARLSVDLTI